MPVPLSGQTLNPSFRWGKPSRVPASPRPRVPASPCPRVPVSSCPRVPVSPSPRVPVPASPCPRPRVPVSPSPRPRVPRKTKKKDTVTKPALYHQLRVPEYFLFDPTQDYMDPSLQGHRLVNERYELIAPDAQGALVSEQLGLRLCPEGSQLMFYRLDTGERLLTDEEARRAAEEALQSEASARRAAEAEVARLREELRRRGGIQ